MYPSVLVSWLQCSDPILAGRHHRGEIGHVKHPGDSEAASIRRSLPSFCPFVFYPGHKPIEWCPYTQGVADIWYPVPCLLGPSRHIQKCAFIIPSIPTRTIKLMQASIITTDLSKICKMELIKSLHLASNFYELQ